MLKYKHMIIRFSLGGVVLRIGCQRIPFTDKEVLKKALCDYLDDPDATEKRFLATDWAMHGEDQTVAKDGELFIDTDNKKPQGGS
jgi:hypothetical protein